MRGNSWSRAIRILGVIIILSVAWLQLALPPLPHDPPLSSESLEPDPALSEHQNPVAKFLQSIQFHKPYEKKKELTADEILEIQEQILLRSQNETLLNEELFGPVQHDTIVIVVQVHNRLEYLRHLIVSMAQARYIDTVLLIFSHDYYDEHINKLVTTIDFCKVMQIFYPHSLQTHPHSFPGEGIEDCPRDTSLTQAKSLNCIGNPDLYGHYREARYAQTKHHWWWKANKVFDDLWVLRNHTGLTLFLEEDHYVAEDFLHMLMLYNEALPQACPKCSVITLGNYLKNYNFANDAKRQCTESFCNHDDYNWDWSLQHVSAKCLSQKLFTFSARAPRIFHIGECGVHHKKKDCSSRLILNKVRHTLSTAQRALFPHQLVVLQAPIKKTKAHKGNGGWGDKRDHALCRSFAEDTTPQSVQAAQLIPEPIEALDNWKKNETLRRRKYLREKYFLKS
ncbi:Alpha-1,6-mannosyl-glycoprotein 2-beta-N-acetylglucosaminyltransferase [Armadillidium vulgare]|nr:Alpha-1,6-mannosyl-glycoprotein 2-beta-N-acetylglucosaminyltransferase [Armadillidium vulgare]